VGYDTQFASPIDGSYAVGGTQFSEHIFKMGLDGQQRDTERIGNFLIAQALSQQQQKLRFPVGKKIIRWRLQGKCVQDLARKTVVRLLFKEVLQCGFNGCTRINKGPNPATRFGQIQSGLQI